MAASNTPDCFSEVVGLRVIGVLFNALPNSDIALALETKTLIFEDLTGLTISNNGSFWRESVEEIERAVALREQQLINHHKELKHASELVYAVNNAKNNAKNNR